MIQTADRTVSSTADDSDLEFWSDSDSSETEQLYSIEAGMLDTPQPNRSFRSPPNTTPARQQSVNYHDNTRQDASDIKRRTANIPSTSHPQDISADALLPSPRLEVGTNSRANASVLDQEVGTDTDTDTDTEDETEDDFASPVSLSSGRHPTSFVATGSGQSAGASPARVPSSSPSPSPSRSSQRQTTVQLLGRAATMPILSSSQSPESPAPFSRSKSLNDQSQASSPSNSQTRGNTSPSFPQSEDGFVIIAHDVEAQNQMDAHGLSWGTQYEIARGVSHDWWKWDDVTKDRLRTFPKNSSNQQSAPRVAEMLGRGRVTSSNYILWMELDREQAALVEGKDRGLGVPKKELHGEINDWYGEKNWYGGRIQQIVRLVKSDNNEWELKLDAMRMGRSHRFARYLGSRRILLMKLPKDLYSLGHLKAYLEQKFVLCGRVYVPFAVKEGKVYMMEVDENYGREPRDAEGDQHRLSLEALVKWHNPLDLNWKQEVTKWTARFDLGLSTSVPVWEFDPENIELIGDQYAPHNEKGKVPSHKIFTDGCGYMNGAALMTIGQQMGYSSRPTAVQGRFMGSKGVWALHPDDHDPAAPPRIWVRESQQKIRLFTGGWNSDRLKRVHRAHRIFDLLAPSRLVVPSRLNRLAILNLYHNGVPKERLVELMEEGLRQEVDALRQWEGEGAMQLLWHAVNKASSVTAQRLQRIGAGLQRALGLAGREDDNSQAEIELSEDAVEDLPRGAVSKGKPPSAAETVLDKLQSGLTPLKDLQLCQDVKRVIRNSLDSYIKDYHIMVPSSAEAFIIPDPFDVLGPGEIHFKSSQFLRDPLKNLDPQILTGDVLIYRNPARLPSDVQKVLAVLRPELSDYVDVIVLPVKGDRSLASLLAGGDVDGDTAVCIFDKEMVDRFVEPPITQEPSDLMQYFEPIDTILSVGQANEELQSCKLPGDAARLLQRYLLTGLCENRVGLYSMMHENCIYEFGYDHPDTIRVAHMFNIVLDSRKTGKKVKDEGFQSDRRRFGNAAPECLGGPADSGGRKRVPCGHLKRPDGSPGFILEALLGEGRTIESTILAEYETKILRLQDEPPDPDLLRPYEDAQKIVSLKCELSKITAVVDQSLLYWRNLWTRPNDPSPPNKNKKERQQSKQANDTIRHDVLALYAQVPVGADTFVALGRLDAVKASYAYHISYNKSKGAAFAWAVAHRDLCKIKAESSNSCSFTQDFANVMAIPGAAVRVFAQHMGGPWVRDT